MDNLAVKISSTLRNMRHQWGWSLDRASQETGVSKAMLGQIERGESSPTIATLWKIASGFKASFSSFIEDFQLPTGDFIHRQQDLRQIHQEDDKIKVMSLFAYDHHLRFEAFVIELLPGCEHFSPPHQKGVIEHLIVSQGHIEVLLGDVWQVVGPQEGLRFNADRPHGYRNLSSQSAVFHDMIHYPVAS